VMFQAAFIASHHNPVIKETRSPTLKRRQAAQGRHHSRRPQARHNRKYTRQISPKCSVQSI